MDGDTSSTAPAGPGEGAIESEDAAPEHFAGRQIVDEPASSLTVEDDGTLVLTIEAQGAMPGTATLHVGQTVDLVALWRGEDRIVRLLGLPGEALAHLRRGTQVWIVEMGEAMPQSIYGAHILVQD